ncbi:UDP-N-acetylmuramoyl-L-alanine--D-glutamate ligase [Arundinibacter roseus]|uniref:UDP-N-acetylmuramoylalanine--D-glutamate ligase n=1 Tax=Arundinibacter roseus TaxID=2070510 RepID=A0A4R4KBV2_9BACT|nr:UDP-N-acetylmuramoyl-L-alanine--D-glutamate ligase [Arundinibacter roseus]TDB63689.1 UDP-N-acetylmuramoyl-L-alanine--D-glutamate ligase [Arundinibacter roseus]
MEGTELVILGGGESGVGAALLAKSLGMRVFVSDSNPLQEKYRNILKREAIPFEEGCHTEDRVFSATEVIKSPGIPDDAPLVAEVYRRNISVISEIEFASRYTDSTLIGITGSNGKTTTTLLIYHLLAQAGLSVGLAGNIGDSFARQIMEGKKEVYVLELSSFQLDNMYQFRADVAVLLNITPDHLDRYRYDFQKYVDSKFRITQNQTEADEFIYFSDSHPIPVELVKRPFHAKQLPISLSRQVSEGGFLIDETLIVKRADVEFRIQRNELPIQGPHNAVNAMAAILVAQRMGLTDEQIINGLRTFKNAPHRLELVGVYDGVSYINDSKATNVDSVYYALGSFDRPIILIAGGVDKGNDYSQIKELVQKKVKGLIVIGKDTTKLMTYFSDIVPQIYSTDSLEEALVMAKSWSVPYDVVLLSPACASFDMFKNYVDRGDQFRSQVQNMFTKN